MDENEGATTVQRPLKSVGVEGGGPGEHGTIDVPGYLLVGYRQPFAGEQDDPIIQPREPTDQITRLLPPGEVFNMGANFSEESAIDAQIERPGGRLLPG
jgi:hypothetical protein